VVVALIFAHRIRTTFGPEESFCSLSQSLYKLESKKMMLYYKNKQPTTGGTRDAHQDLAKIGDLSSSSDRIK